MPDRKTINAARRDKKEGKSASTQAGEFVKEEIDHIREGQHGARSAKQAIAIGLSKARRAGVKLKVPAKGTVSEETRKKAQRDNEKGKEHAPVSRARSRATVKALQKEPRTSVSHTALSRQAHKAAKQRTAAQRSASAKKAVRTKGPKKLAAAGKKAAKTRAKSGK